MNSELISADVVIIGAGPAGMAAAASASRAGASVIVVESGSRLGGNAVRSNGYLAFVDSDAAARDAFVADARAAYRQAADEYGLVWDEPAIRQFAAASATTYRILTRRGVRFSRRVPRPEHSVDRIQAVVDPVMFGRAYAPDFAQTAVRTEFGVRAERLIVEEGRIAGVIAHRIEGGMPLTVRARRAVVLATGGYQAGHRLRARYQSFASAQSSYFGTPDCRGDGHVMGSIVGGDLVNMAYLPPTVLAASTVVENAIAVNSVGARFHDETGPFADRVAALRQQDQRRAWYLLDEQVARSQAHLIEQMPQPPTRVTNVAELVAILQVPAERLTATIGEWNNFLASTAISDPQFGRTALPQGRRALGEHLLAVPMVEGVNISCGGFRTTTRMQVIDVFGAMIPGLYAAGDTTAGLNAAAGMVGLHISGAFTQGRIAGHAAAAARPDISDYGNLLATPPTCTRLATAGADRVTPASSGHR
ncbi:FAD-dependent oxidoreductase [Mycobacterium sp. Y57]|uniref:FAD-dependent oxidoreductase n=1 Tax=Mycolicibacterium xanthum TaxID=2796469 RepID=UPI001C853FF9|nr:FAD-dependent oxidoreductase [Mycolicibacterium xanthum]MBX7434769.1 FAD-dependent oxidoreductase [Mycolicibacterium xanthum]